MPSQASGSLAISIVVILFAVLLAATPPLAMLTVPHEPPASRSVAQGSAFA